jgi:hypothetical protein
MGGNDKPSGDRNRHLALRRRFHKEATESAIIIESLAAMRLAMTAAVIDLLLLTLIETNRPTGGGKCRR